MINNNSEFSSMGYSQVVLPFARQRKRKQRVESSQSYVRNFHLSIMPQKYHKLPSYLLMTDNVPTKKHFPSKINALRA